MARIIIKRILVLSNIFVLYTEFNFLHIMELSQMSGKEADSPPHRWANILGTIIAVLTITLPLLMISYYSPSRSNAETSPQSRQTMINH